MSHSDHDLHLHAARQRADALARAIKAAMAGAELRIPPPIKALESAQDPSAIIQAIEEAGLAEEALDWVRSHDRNNALLRTALDPLAAKSKAQRASRIHLEGNRVRARARYLKEASALTFSSPDLQTLFCEVLKMEGLSLELDLGKRPKPLVTCAPTLPPGVAGDAEWLEIQLTKGSLDPSDLLSRLNRRLPEGLRLLDWDEQPPWASPIAELCTGAHWSWETDSNESASAITRFVAAETFPLEKIGKIEGQKQGKQIDLRPIVQDMAWDENRLIFTTTLGATVALNPLKILGAILERSPDSIQHLRRTGFSIADDPRLRKSDRYTSKLKNMFEDAVLLGGPSNITIVDEDEDESILLR